MAARSIERVSTTATRASSSANKVRPRRNQDYLILHDKQVNYEYYEVEAIIVLDYFSTARMRVDLPAL